MKHLDTNFLDDLTRRAQASPRLRQHQNLHQSYQEPCQRLCNALEPGSYIRPHRHASDPRDELLVALRGLMALVTFDDDGHVLNITGLATEKYGPQVCAAMEVPATVWHTVVTLTPGCVLLEVKAGPFDPESPKDLATWAPAEASPQAPAYLEQLVQRVRSSLGR